MFVKLLFCFLTGGAGTALTVAQGNDLDEGGSAKRVGLLEEFNQNTSSIHVSHRPSLSKGVSKSSPTDIVLDATASYLSLFKELGSSLWLFMKKQNMLSVAVIAAIVLIFIIMQVNF